MGWFQLACIQSLNLSHDEVRSIILDSFKSDSSSQYESLCGAVAYLAIQKGIVPNPNPNNSYMSSVDLHLQEQDKNKVREIIWDLIIERVLTIGMNANNANWPWLSLTEYGKRVVDSELPVPHDPNGYLERVRNEIPDIDPVIFTYLEESLRTYNINALLSSTVSLGCASERGLLLLIEAYAAAITDPGRKQKFEEKTTGRMIKRQFDEFRKAFSSVQGSMPANLLDGFDTTLLGVFEIIRNNRNDAGHPTGKTIPKEQAFANLQVFIPYCKKIYQLISFFKSNPI